MFSLVFLFGLLLVGVYIGIRSASINLDPRQEAAGKTYFVENSESLQDAINKSKDSDSIFLKVGTYSTTNSDGFIIKDKKIQILGAGKDFVTVLGNNNSYVFNVQNSSVKFDSIKIKGANKDGILIKNSGKKDVVLKSIEIENNSGAGVRTDSKTTISTSFIDQNGSGIVSSGELLIDNTVIQNSAAEGLNIDSTSVSNSRITNSIISGNQGKGMLIEGGKSHIVKNVTLFKNNSGLVETGSSTTNITDSIIQGSKNEGVNLKGTSSSISFSNVYSNGTDFTPTSLKNADGNLSVDSQFTSETDLHIVKTSTAVRNKGLASETNADGTRIDMGAFGGKPNLVSSNGAPVISSTPLKYIKPGQAYNYEVVAVDPDNDVLTYTVVNSNSPKWIKQDGNKFSGTPGEGNIGFWGIVLVVSDSRGHNIVHPISINVIPADRSIPQEGTSPTPTASAAKPVAKINFINPKAGSVMTKDANEIKWEIANGVAIDKYVIKYSDDKEVFRTITTLPGDATSYKWVDIDKLVPGKYILQIEATDKSAPPVTIKVMSEEFEVKSVPVNTNVQSIVITKNSPADNDNVPTRKPLIAVEFKPDADLDASKTYIKIDGENVTYKFTKNTIYFEPTKDLAGTKTQVEAKIVTKDGAEASKKWFFNLPVSANPQNTKVTVSSTSTVLGLPRIVGLLLIAVIILGLLFLILYFVIKLLKTIRDERQGNLEAEFTEYYDGDNLDPNIRGSDNGSVAVVPVILESQADKPTPTSTEYIVSPNANAEYYVDQSTTNNDTEVQNPPSPVYFEPVVNKNNDVPVILEQTIHQSAPVEVTEKRPEVITEDPNQPIVNVVEVPSDNIQYPSNDNVQQSVANAQPIPVDNQTKIVNSNDLGEQSSDLPADANNPESPSDDYMTKLKMKYGITDDDIENYKVIDVDAKPDPTAASTSPKNS